MTVALITKGRVCQNEIVLQFGLNIIAELNNCSVSCDNCGYPEIKIGNSATLLFLVTSDGVRLTNSELSMADDIIFSVKEDEQDLNIDSLIFKNVGNGVTILPDGDEESPNIQVDLSSQDTEIVADSYPTGLQIDFTASDCKEAQLMIGTICFNEIYFSQDVIRCP